MDAVLVPVPAVADLRAARSELIPRFRAVVAALRATPDGGRCRFGVRQSAASLALEDAREVHPILGAWVEALVGALSAYEVVDTELWFNHGGRIFPHNDGVFWLRSGGALGLQLWLLLDAVDLTRDGVVDAADARGLVCWVPRADGPVFAPMGVALTPAGDVPLEPGATVSATAPGDLLVFKNGVVHHTPRSVHPAPTLRIALAMRCIRREDRSLAADPAWRRWFASRMRDDPELHGRLARNPYFRLLGADPGGAITAPTKEDHHRLEEVAGRLREVRPPW